MRTKITLLMMLLLVASLIAMTQQKPKITGIQVQTTGIPGSAAATTTLSGEVLPAPDARFGGVIKEKASESIP